MIIPVTSNLGIRVDLKVDDRSDVARLGLSGLVAKAVNFANLANTPLDRTDFISAVFGGTYQSPSVALNQSTSLSVTSGANTSFRIIRGPKEALFEDQEAPPVTVLQDQAWVAFSLDTSLAVSASMATPQGFGLSGEHLQTRSVTTYLRLERQNGALPTVQTALEQVISAFRIPRSAADLFNQPPNTVYEWDADGVFTLEGSYGYPFAVNALSLAEAKLPFGKELNVTPAFELGLAGSVSITGEFLGRSYRSTASSLQLGLYKKRGTDVSASFTAQAGMAAEIGSTDLLGVLGRALPGANLDTAQLDPATRESATHALSAAIDQGLSIAVNLSCSAARLDETAILYEIDLTGDADATRPALEAALGGNWTLLSKSKTVRELRNAITRTRETGSQAILHLLGLYDYASAQEFVRQCRVLHNQTDGSVTITDSETAEWIKAAATPWASDDKRLRKVLQQAFLATAAYGAAGATLTVSQRLVAYKARENYSTLRKDLLTGLALGVLQANDLAGIPLQSEYRYFRLSANCLYDKEDTLRLFFSDTAARKPRKESDLKLLGRQTMIALLDPSQPVDAARRRMLADDALWAQLEQQKFPQDSPASYSDWYDITHWAAAIAAVAPRLNTVLTTLESVQGDPSKDTHFMTARQALAGALAEVTRNTHAAFEAGWPMAVMYLLSGGLAALDFQAQWDGVKRFDKQAAKVLRA